MLYNRNLVNDLVKAGARDVLCELFNASVAKMPVRSHAVSDVIDRLPLGYDMKFSEKKVLNIINEEVEEVRKNANECIGSENIEYLLIGILMFIAHGDENSFYEYLDKNINYERIYYQKIEEGAYLLNIIESAAKELANI